MPGKVVRGKLCPECGGAIHLGKERYTFRGVYFGEFEVYVCGRCGDSSFTPAGARAVDRVARAKGLFGVDNEVHAHHTVAHEKARA